MKKIGTLAAFCAAGLMSSAAMAIDIHVPADRPTIQQAISAAKDGDRVLVAPGTYRENISFEGKRIDVLSTDGPAVTTIDGSAREASVVRIVESSKAEDDKTRGAVLSGFRIQNGSVSGQGYGTGGGVYISNASPTISDNEIAHNDACAGGGVYADRDSAPHIVRNHIHHNNSISYCVTFVTYGGGVYADFPKALVIENNLVEYNGADIGGGIALVQFTGTNGGRATVARNVIRKNADGIYAELTHLRLLGNVIASNGSYGAEINDEDYLSSIHVVNNTFADHDNVDVNIEVNHGHLAFINNLVSSRAGSWAVYCSLRKGGKANISNNLVYTTRRRGVVGDCNFTDGGLIEEDPLLVGGDGDHVFWLTANSPAIDKGNNDAARRLKRDASGKARIVNGTVDLGAYEFRGH